METEDLSVYIHEKYLLKDAAIHASQGAIRECTCAHGPLLASLAVDLASEQKSVLPRGTLFRADQRITEMYLLTT